MDQKIAEKAARWWASKLERPAKLDNGGQSEEGDLALILGMLQQEECAAIDAAKIAKFETALTRELVANPSEYVTLRVDYGPDVTLEKALKEAGVESAMTVLPWKTEMQIVRGVIRVWEGATAGPMTV